VASPTAEVGFGAERRRGRRGLVRVPAALLLLGMATALGYLGLATPSGDDLPERVADLTDGRPLQPAEVPLLLMHAVTAAEDERFFEHHGLDTVGTARALGVDVTGRCACEGGSTITQQLAKTVYYPDHDRVARKVPGMAVALKIELRYDKRQIMADYLSVVPTGFELVGARAAACAYFGRGLAELSAAQAAELAGSVQLPAATDPRYHPDRARARRDHVLDRMVAVGYLDAAPAAVARAEPVLLPQAGRSTACSRF
jgi:membrane peptidoglycan carboxypeptidase